MTGCSPTHGQTPTETTNTSTPIGLFRGLLGRGGPQTKKLAYLYGIAVASVWLTIGLWVEIKAEWNWAFGLFLGAVTTGYVGGKKVGVEAPPASGPKMIVSQSSTETVSAKIEGQP